MRKGERIRWQSQHKGVFEGVFVRKVRLPEYYKELNRRGAGFPRWAIVQFDGRRYPTRVLYRQLERAK